MIKITRFFYIHWLILPLVLLAYFSGGFHTMFTAYAVVFVHEIFHLLMALAVGERVGSVIIMPFGMTLRLSAKVIRHTEKEIAIALAGPAANLLLLMLTGVIKKAFDFPPLSLYIFQFLNLSVLLLNLLPCLPLDGGRVLKALLIRRMGYLSAVSVMARLSRIITSILLVLGVLLLFFTRMNVSLLMAAGFLTLYMVEEKKRNEYILMQELVYAKDKLRKKGLMRSCSVSALEAVPARDIFKMLSFDSYCIIHILDSDQNHLRAVTEAQLVDSILEKGWHICLAEV